MTLTTQWTTIFVMMSSGCLMGITLDIYRVLSRHLGLKGWAVSLVDLLYWLVSAGLVFSLLFWSNWGDFRFYLFVAIISGFFVYFKWCSQKVSAWIDWTIVQFRRFMYQMYRVLYHVVYTPLVYLWQVVIKVLRVIWMVVRNLLLWLWKPVSWLLSPFRKVWMSFSHKYISWMWKSAQPGPDKKDEGD